MENHLGIIVLAAGMGTRMNSDRAKVLHEIKGKPMIQYVADVSCSMAAERVVVVVGHQSEQVKAAVSGTRELVFADQKKQLGTGHAVLCALPQVPLSVHNVIVLCGDVPLLRRATLKKLVAHHESARGDLTVLAVDVEKPTGYGRIMVDEQGQLTGIVEEADATPEQRNIRTINSGIYCVRRSFLAEALGQIKTDNRQGEFYLTDIVAVGYREKRTISVFVGDDPEEVAGVNNCQELAVAEQILDRRMKR